MVGAAVGCVERVEESTKHAGLSRGRGVDVSQNWSLEALGDDGGHLNRSIVIEDGCESLFGTRMRYEVLFVKLKAHGPEPVDRFR